MGLDEYLQQLNKTHKRIGALLLLLVFIASSQMLGFIFAFLFILPLIAWIFSRWLVNHKVGDIADLYRRSYYRGTEGNYHAFDDIAVRVCWNNGCCFVSVEDVFRVLRITGGSDVMQQQRAFDTENGTIKDRYGVWWLSEHALLHWLRGKAHNLDDRPLRFQRWLERETFPPMRKKAELGLLPDTALFKAN